MSEGSQDQQSSTIVKLLAEYQWHLPITPINISSSIASSLVHIILAGVGDRK